jgi:hypothetical protein
MLNQLKSHSSCKSVIFEFQVQNGPEKIIGAYLSKLTNFPRGLESGEAKDPLDPSTELI